jgi:hypothetical protein
VRAQISWSAIPSSGDHDLRVALAHPVVGDDEHINALTKKYINQDEYPFRQPGEQRVKFVITPQHVRHMKQG